ncbi:MAG TPA: MFS transporter [Mycobacteriales bacterium]|nr:MFS transporter [Mycobacteriales bacterium]
MTTLTAGASFSSERTRVLARPAAFWGVVAATATLLAASSAPSPLYAVYQAEYHFSAITLTAVFAVYVLALLASLLTIGRISDVLGRRPVLAAALVLEAAAMGVFLDARGVSWLYAARTLQGIATGAAVGVLGAYLLDLQPPGGSRLGSLMNSVAATGGLGVGAVVTGVLVQFAPHPTRLIFVVFIAAFALLLVLTAFLPETAPRVPGARPSIRPQIAVPTAARRHFVKAAPTMISTWMLGGLIFSVGGSVLVTLFGETNHAIVGLVIGAFSGAGAITSTLLRDVAPVRMARIGTLILVVGVALFVGALATTSLAVFIVGAVLAGAGFGPAFLGAFRTVSQLAEPHARAGLISAIYVVSYLAFSIPALTAGLVIGHAGLRATAMVYGAVVGLVAVATLGSSAKTD